MYFRIKKNKYGEVLQLIESYRNAEGSPRQRLVASLGTPSLAPELYRSVAHNVEQRLAGEQDLPHLQEGSAEIARWVDRICKQIETSERYSKSRNALPSNPQTVLNGVLIEKVSHSHSTSLGPELVGLKAWDDLGLSDCLLGLGFNAKQIRSAKISVINRLCAPVAENSLPDWLRTSALADILEETDHDQDASRYYRVSDKLLANKAEIESQLRRSTAFACGLTRSVILYDLTNTHFEGVGEANPKAKRGCNKQKRNDCVQVVVAMLYDEYGFQLGHEVFAGNMSDSASLLLMLEKFATARSECQRDFPLIKDYMVIVDAGIATEANLHALRQAGYNYLVNDKRVRRDEYADKFAQAENFSKISDRSPNNELSVMKFDLDRTYKFENDRGDAQEENYKESIVLCQSTGRREKEAAILSKAEERFLERIASFAKRLEGGNLKDPQKIQQQIGRIQQKYAKAARFYDIRLSEDSPKSIADKIDGKYPASRLLYDRHQDKYDEANDLLGCYALRTLESTLDAQQLWKLYITLTVAEEGFRLLKSDLGLRPNFHQAEHRVDGHIFISCIAYQLLRYILHKMSQAGDVRSWPTLRRILSTHTYSTMTLPTEDGKIYKNRKPGTPELAQQQIYQIFDIKTADLPSTQNIF